MIKEIVKPNIDFKFHISNSDIFYYDEDNKEYFIEDKNNNKFYFNLNGEIHRIGKPAAFWGKDFSNWCQNGEDHRDDGPSRNSKFDCFNFWLKGNCLNQTDYAILTDHLICIKCKKFCKQNCF